MTKPYYTLKEFIEDLSKGNPDARVRFYTEVGDKELTVLGVYNKGCMHPGCDGEICKRIRNINVDLGIRR